MDIQQTLFPFYVNGQYWRHIPVDEALVRTGCVHFAVMRRGAFAIRSGGPADPLCYKKVCFALASLTEHVDRFRAHDLDRGFWLVDPDVHVDRERGELWLTDQQRR